MKNASIRDIARTVMTTTGTIPRIWPNIPVTNSSGANAAIVVKTPITTGPMTPLTPRKAPTTPRCPASCSVMMFSPTTTASSTTIPSTMIRANRETMLILTPRKSKNRKAPRKEIGTPMATQIASRRSSITTRNRNTSAKPRVPLRTSRLNLSERNSD